MRPVRWRPRVLASEARRNATSWAVRSVMLAALWGLGAGALMLADLSFVGRLVDTEQRLLLDGRDVYVASAPGGVDGARCAASTRVQGVLAAGPARHSGRSRLAAAPGTLVGRVEAGAGAVAVWDPAVELGQAAMGPSYLAGEGLARELSLVPGVLLGAGDLGALPVAAVVAAEGRNPDVSRSVITLVAPTGSFETCWVETAPYARAVALPLLRAWFAASDVTVRPLLAEHRLRHDPVAAFRARSHARAWLVAAAALTLAWWLLLWLRRPEIGLYRSLGMTRADLALLAEAELALVAGFGAVAGSAWAAAMFFLASEALSPGQLWLALSLAGRAPLSALLLALALAPLPLLVRGRDDVLAALRDR